MKCTVSLLVSEIESKAMRKYTMSLCIFKFLLLILQYIFSRYDFEMVYIREEGIKASYLCGNGTRCIVAFAHYLKVPHKAEKYSFWACDGPHIGWVDDITGQVHVKFKYGQGDKI